MPINFTDFSRLPTTDSGLGDLLGKAIEGFRAQRMPGMMNREQQQQELRNALLGMQNKYYPQIQDQKLKQGEIGLKASQLNLDQMPEQFKRQQQESELKQSLYKLRAENQSLQNQFLPEAHRAKVAKLEAETEKAKRYENNARKTPQQRNLETLYPPGSPEYNDAMKSLLGLGGANGDRPVRFNDLPKNEQLDVSKRMRNDLRAAHEIKKATGVLNEMEKIMNEHPNLADSLSNIFIDPKKDSTILSKFGKSFLDKKERAAIEKFVKLSNELILHGGQALGAKNFTDAKAKMLELSKPVAGNSQEANLFLIKNMRKQFDPWQAYAEDLKKGLKNREVVEFDLDKYESPEDEDEWEVIG